jgi:ATP-binding cassette, subfamily B, multidrug efflux pump
MFKLLKNFKKKEVILIIICIIFIVFQVWLDLKLPDYMTNITILVKTPGSEIKDILKEGSYMLLCAGGSLVSAIIVGYLASFISATFSFNIRKKLFNQVESYSMEEMKKFSISSLITRTTNDITNIQMLISMGLQMIIKAPITAVWAICKIINKGWQWSIATGIGVLALILLVTILLITVLPKFKLVQKLIDNINELTREHLKGIRVIRAFNAEEFEEQRFEKGNINLTNLQTFTQKMMSLISPAMYLIMNLLALSIYVIGAYLIDKANMMDKITLFSNMVVFSSYAMQVIMSFLMLAFIFVMYPRASVSADRINEVLNTYPSIKDGPLDHDNNVKGQVEFKNVSFKYPDSEEYVLKDISFIAKKGETIAFIGSTGSGKSTLINLVPRFYDVTEGEILIDNINVKDYKLNLLHNKLGYISQKAIMFNDTIKNNIAYGNNGAKKINDKEIWSSLAIAQGKDFVSKMDKGLEANLAEGGTNVSGGQKQRISIARAIARKPEIYLFDDSFSALDYKTDYTLRKELKKNLKDATVLIVAQRIGTIKDADKIVVLDEGKCVGIGTHKELLKTCEVYQEIAYSQVSKEELENA